MVADEAPHVEIDEQHMREWCEWGYKELLVYLNKHAAFRQWCDDNRKDQDDQDKSSSAKPRRRSSGGVAETPGGSPDDAV